MPLPLALALACFAIFGAMLSFDALGRAGVGTYPVAVVRLARLCSLLGEGATWLVPCGLLLIGLGFVRLTPVRRDAALRQIWLRLFFVFSAVAGSGIIVILAKNIIGRARPLQYDALVPLWFEPMRWSAKFASFPSGHATTAATVAVALILLFGPRIRPYALALVLIVCAGRVMLGAHYVSDVLGGLLLGWLVTRWYARWLARKGLVFRLSGDGRLALRGETTEACLSRILARSRP